MYLKEKPTNMCKKSSRRAWNILRFALIWARKGGVFRNRLAINFSIIHKVIRKLIHSNESRRALVYGDREFSFDETPIIHVKMHRPSSSLRFKMPHIPCIKPHVDFDYDDEEEDVVMSEDELMWCGEKCEYVRGRCLLEEEDKDIDLKAEEFIAEFHEQMKLQRQISRLY